MSQLGYFSVMVKCWNQDIWLALLGQWVRHQNTNLQISIWIKRDLCLLLLHKYIKNIYHTHTRISYLFLKITSLRLFGKKIFTKLWKNLNVFVFMFNCRSWIQGVPQEVAGVPLQWEKPGVLGDSPLPPVQPIQRETDPHQPGGRGHQLQQSFHQPVPLLLPRGE